MNIWQFMSNSPFLTFFLVLLIGWTVVEVVRAICHYEVEDEE